MSEDGSRSVSALTGFDPSRMNYANKIGARVLRSLERIAASADEPGSQRNMMITAADAGVILEALCSPLCSFCNNRATTMVSDESAILEACPACALAWKRDPGFMAEFTLDQRNAFIALMEEIGSYIYDRNGPRVMPLKQAWNRAFPFAKAAAAQRDSGSDPKGEDTGTVAECTASQSGRNGIAQTPPSEQSDAN